MERADLYFFVELSVLGVVARDCGRLSSVVSEEEIRCLGVKGMLRRAILLEEVMVSRD